MVRPKYLRGRVSRFTRLDGCGNPVPGPDSTVVNEEIVTIEYTSNTQDGEAVTVTLMSGKTCINDTPAPQFTGFGVNITFCGVDPVGFNIVTGQNVVLDAQGEPVGFDIDSDVDLDQHGFALETWLGAPASACAPGVAAVYGYGVWPFLKGGVLGDFTIENGAINFTITGAQTKDGSGWGVGPYNVTLDEDGQESPLLTPLSTKNHMRLIQVNVPPPVDTGEATPLGVPATGATAGIPGTFTPANSYGPKDLAGMTGITASPSTAWTTGQYVRTRDGDTAHWSGSAWVANPA